MAKAPELNSHITIENVAVPVTREELDLDDVQLDPENPRIREHLKQMGKSGRINGKDLRKVILEISGVSALFRSVRENKGLHEPIYIRHDGRVAEGNCRTAIYQALREAQKNEPCWMTIPVLRLPKDVTERQIAVLQGHMHVAGKITWRAHEQAGHLYRMNRELKMKPAEISAAMGMSETDVNRQIQAYETMTNDVIPRIKKGDGREKFSYVLEFYKNRKLKDFRADEKNVKVFTDLVVKDKLKKGADVRKLHRVLGHDSAKKVLQKEGFDKALQLVGKTDPTADSSMFRKLKSATKALDEIRRPLLDRIREGTAEKKILQSLYTSLKRVADATGTTFK